MKNVIDLLGSVGSVSSVRSVLKDGISNELPPPDLDDALDDLQLQFEHAQSMVKDSPNVFLKASMNIAAMEIFTVLNRFDTVTLSKRLEEKPELYFQLLNAQFNMAKAHLEQQKFEFKQKQAKARQRERSQKLRARKPILITCRALTSLTSSLDRNRPEDAQAYPVNQILENAVPASNIQHPANSSFVDPVPAVISVLKNAPNQSSGLNESNPRTRSREPGVQCAEPLVTANSGNTDLLNYEPLHFSHVTTADEPRVRHRPEPVNCEPLWSQPAPSDAIAEDLVCCPS